MDFLNRLVSSDRARLWMFIVAPVERRYQLAAVGLEAGGEDPSAVSFSLACSMR